MLILLGGCCCRTVYVPMPVYSVCESRYRCSCRLAFTCVYVCFVTLVSDTDAGRQIGKFGEERFLWSHRVLDVPVPLCTGVIVYRCPMATTAGGNAQPIRDVTRPSSPLASHRFVYSNPNAVLRLVDNEFISDYVNRLKLSITIKYLVTKLFVYPLNYINTISIDITIRVDFIIHNIRLLITFYYSCR